MIREFDISFRHPLKGRRMACVTALLAVALAFALPGLPETHAFYSSNDKDMHVFVLPDIKVSLTEEWNVQDGLGLTQGVTVAKRPIVSNEAEACYMRVIVRLFDERNSLLTPMVPTEDERRFRTILGTLWSDPLDAIEIGTPYSTAELQDLEGVTRLYDDAVFEEPYYDEELGGLVFCI